MDDSLRSRPGFSISETVGCLTPRDAAISPWVRFMRSRSSAKWMFSNISVAAFCALATTSGFSVASIWSRVLAITSLLLQFIQVRRKLAVCNWDHYFIKPFLVPGLVTGAEKNPLTLWIERKECPDRISFALDPQLFHVAVG
uniref:Uncharacterized protein n=2 Tax=Gammaproteobacteria TaxID=1236 RepID=W0RXA3_KLEPN|nr:hypothetical protein [Aeromonas hydrophila]AHG97083.1 hypothetical protein [Klebsiella pneumoniae]